MSDRDLASVAIHAEARNRTLDIVGVLFVAGNRLLQVLEGQQGAVRWLYDVIAKDPRHRQVTKLMDRPIQRRVFDGWSMRFVCDADLADSSRSTVLQSLETAAALDVGGEAELSALGDLQDCPTALVGAILERVGRGGRQQTAEGWLAM
jgi:hypothetical protein